MWGQHEVFWGLRSGEGSSEGTWPVCTGGLAAWVARVEESLWYLGCRSPGPRERQIEAVGVMAPHRGTQTRVLFLAYSGCGLCTEAGCWVPGLW